MAAKTAPTAAMHFPRNENDKSLKRGCTTTFLTAASVEEGMMGCNFLEIVLSAEQGKESMVLWQFCGFFNLLCTKLRLFPRKFIFLACLHLPPSAAVADS
jgi:hypothetical protein